MEDFLFKMLGDGFKLKREVIREVLGSCGYDMKKSMEILLNRSITPVDERLGSEKNSTDMTVASCSRSDLISRQRNKPENHYLGGNGNIASSKKDMELTNREKARIDLQKEVLTALFNASEEPEEELPRRTVPRMKQSRARDWLLSEPFKDMEAESEKRVEYEEKPSLDDEAEESNYQLLRKAVREYRGTMKEYYASGIDAFAKGDSVRAAKLIDEAQEADEQSSQLLFEPRNADTEDDEMLLDLHDIGGKEAVRVLKSQISSLSGIPSIKHLKVIFGADDKDTSKRSCRRLVMKLLEKESIQWTEEENGSSIVIRGSGITMSGSVKDVQSKAELDGLLRSDALVILHFWASWCEASKHMDQVEAEEQPEISEAYSVAAVPYFVFIKDGKTVDTLEGADPSSLAHKVAKASGSINAGEPAAPASSGMAAGAAILETVRELARDNGSVTESKVQPGLSSALQKKIQQLIDSNPIMLFMKGSPEEPNCGFSRKVVDILKEENVNFGSFDILSDNEIREGLKKFSNWPTFPQLYCKGELLGGSDIAIAMHESGELKEVFRDHGIGTSHEVKPAEPDRTAGVISENSGLSAALASRLKMLVNLSPVMLFMKGKPDEPKCGFSHKVVEILREENVNFESFDILSDDEVRQGLKDYSNWSSYPQLYIKGELIGGSDIVLQMHRSGELRKVLESKGIVKKDTSEDRLKKLTTSSPVMLFMKGTPDAPRCGFSSKVVNALNEEGIGFGSFDILTDDEVRQGLKVYSNWPTFPQLYYKGELIGGCDIVLELRSSGELKSTLFE
ncbi:Monothiol glutaredoxin-S17 [Cucurbita argyrosperma subsp. argyrosperma]|nr:Monothiol glutaredoxin-S17 [Cucurbita argyrosperma subsp. argyrosperma]